MAADPQLARDVFLAVIELPPPQRAAFLAEACGSDAELRREVERLLAGAAKPDSLLDAPDAARDLAAMTQRFNFVPRGNPSSREPLPPGTRIDDRFTLEEVIGTGGMGTVYRARQSEPVQRLVALKLIRPGMDSQSVLARFDTERQALARMEHPHIARILDGGMTEDGQPFFVMEHCHGPPITEYCDRRKLPVAERLRLFVDVCHAVQHAHQKGIIHRDLKPGNVLVGEVDGRAMPKVIDFGIAKATQPHPRDTHLTETGAVVGTPTYMSPEQADPSSRDIDTRTDVYALGVMLYELLTGSPPLEAARFERGSVLEMLRMVREEDPPRPSDRLSTADMLPNIAANRGTDPSPLTRLVRGELDWVVMKALEKDRTRRYDTANGLARDIQRYLADEIVEARPPSRSYRLRKFARRHRIEIVAAALVSAAVLVGIVATSLAYFEALRQKGIALKALQAETEQAAKEREARTVTSARLRQIETTNAALFDLFAEIDIRAIRAGSEPLEAHLAKKLVAFGKSVDESAVGDPLALAKLRTRLAQSLMNLGEAPAAIEFSRSAADILEREQGPAHRDTLAARDLLASAYRLGGQAELAVPICEQALRLLAAVAAEDDDEVLKLKNNLGLALQSAGRWKEALPLLVDVVSRRTAMRGLDDRRHSAA